MARPINVETFSWIASYSDVTLQLKLLHVMIIYNVFGARSEATFNIYDQKGKQQRNWIKYTHTYHVRKLIFSPYRDVLF